jgi:very-short-patch-repair endonuclease
VVFIMFIHSDRSMSFRRKELRNNATSQEIILWKFLKKSQLGYKFRRQHSIGTYVVDFYCASKRIVIEIDGSQHATPEQEKYDYERTMFFESLNHAVLRFWNNEVDYEIEVVIGKIYEILNTTPPSAPLLN